MYQHLVYSVKYTLLALRPIHLVGAVILTKTYLSDMTKEH